VRHQHSADSYRFCPRCGDGLERRLLKDGEPERLVCAACGFVFYLDPKVAAGTICQVDGGVVLLRRAIEPQLGKWVFPGGFVDRGESVHDAAVRETLEEVNLRVRLTGILDVYSFSGHDVAVVVYAADVIGGSLRAGDESLEAEAFAPERIPWHDLAFESTRLALRDYLSRFFPSVRPPRFP
jgi:ADP-ribose pyrophosphatase YjhB (NUDIX family)